MGLDINNGLLASPNVGIQCKIDKHFACVYN